MEARPTYPESMEEVKQGVLKVAEIANTPEP